VSRGNTALAPAQRGGGRRPPEAVPGLVRTRVLNCSTALGKDGDEAAVPLDP
jgi:hypothetical protein